jgi:hypothetical protein
MTGFDVPTAIDIIKQIAIEQATKRAMSKIVALVPFFGLPVVNPVLGYFLAKYATILFEEGALLAQLGYIEVSVNADVRAVNNATDDLKKVLSNPFQNQEEIQKAKDEYKKRLADLIRINS